jgi:hypothetical protein
LNIWESCNFFFEKVVLEEHSKAKQREREENKVEKTTKVVVAT